jgi:lariat debranching enzyme
MACPLKYREIGDFHEYYSGKRKAPYLTIFVGGNHEASNYLWELSYGGWVAPNIFYMGAANVIRLGPLRIAGMSGIWKGYDYNKSHYERLPYNDDDMNSIYHIREFDVRKLLQIRTQVDVAISHDWPNAVEKHGDERHLFRLKPYFEQESKNGTLGSHAAAYVMDRLRPSYWFAAHMHCKFAATRTYNVDTKSVTSAESSKNVNAKSLLPRNNNEKLAYNADEISLDMGDEDELLTTGADGNAYALENPHEPVAAMRLATASVVPEDLRAQLPASFARPATPVEQLQPGQPCPPAIANKVVRFLALDKCLPGRKFLQLLDIEPLSQPSPNSPSIGHRFHLEYDPEWLAITRVFASSLILGDRSAKTPIDLGEEHYRPLIEAEEVWVAEHIVMANKLTIPENFTITAPAHSPGMPEIVQEGPQEYNNPQTAAFCDLVGIENKFFSTEEERTRRMSQGPAPAKPRKDGGGRGRGTGRDREGNRGGRGRGRSRGWR